MMEWLSKLYVNTLNMIHYMHDKYYYEAAEMALDRYRCKTYICNRYRWILSCSRLFELLSNMQKLKQFVMKTES